MAMRLGIDISTYFEGIALGAKYFDGDGEVNPVNAFRENGVDIMRIRVWADPTDGSGKPYLGGTCDFENFVKLAELAQSKGYKIMLDLHYSDFWADPAKQTVPKAWRGLDFDGLVAKVYEYTVETLTAARERGIELEYVQVGNEITNGMLWPHGRLSEQPDGSRTGYDRLVKFIKAGCRGCREVCPEAKIVLHLERSYDIKIYDEFFTNMQRAGVDYDIIGYSYYPYWHGTFAQFYANVDMCKKFGKEQMVVEVGYAFTLEDYIKTAHGGAQLVVSEDNLASFDFCQEYPVSPEGQARFAEGFLKLAREHGISAVIWWEPAWIPGEGVCWASPEGEDYIGESGKSTRNEWANQCMFDYSGKKLPSFDKFKV